MHTQVVDGPEAIAWCGALVTIVLHYTGSAELPPEALGAVLTAAIYPLMMAILRIISRKIKGPGAAGLTSMLFLVAFLFSGCAHHKCAGALSVSIKPSAPSYIGSKCGGEKDDRISITATGDATLRIKCPAGTSIGTKPGTPDVLWCVGGGG